MPRHVTPRLIAALAVLGPVSMALAQDHEAVGPIPTVKQGLITGITALVVFLLVLSVLAVKVWPVMTKALDERSAKIREEIEAAERARKQARDALEQYQKSLAEARAEAQRMLETTKAQQQQLAAELRAKADAELNVLKDRARRDIDAARRAALIEVHDAAIDLATAAASRILKREVTVSDQRRLLDESLGALAGTKN
ncbi:MAG: F0F1 ATP synthase subunit B [Phycisphaerales bacterium]|nr:F0F1 ATP synthase subunit B [Phycisphaerales bacterium]